MKKLLLLFAAAAFAYSAMADVVTFTFRTDTDITYTATGTSGGGAACEVSKGGVTISGTNAYTDSTKTLSVYKNSSMTVAAAGNISQIDVVYNGKVYPLAEALGNDAKDSNGKFSASGAHNASYTPSTTTSSVTLNNTYGGKSELLSLSVTYTPVGDIAATGVSLNKTTTSIYEGYTETLVASVAPLNATNKAVTWTSDNEEVATVSSTGVVTAVAEGTANITVTTTDGGFTATCAVTVNPFSAVTGVTLDQATATVVVYKGVKLAATVAPADATIKTVTWTSSDNTVATVDANGYVRALAAGTATITVTTDNEGKTATCVVTVSAKVAPEGAVFVETFDQFNGVGGNDNKWKDFTDTPALGEFDNEGWETEGSVLSGAQCASIRKYTVTNTDGTKTSYPSGLTTPAIGVAGNGHVQFEAESWGSDGSDFFVEIIGGGTFISNDNLAADRIQNDGVTAKVALQKKGAWKTYDLSFEGFTATSKLRFYSPVGKRAFLDEVAVWVEEPAVENDYYMIGSAELFGADGMKMDANGDDAYRLTLNNVELAGGDYTYNVEARPVVEQTSAPRHIAAAAQAADKSFTLDAGTYSLQFDYNAETGELTSTNLNNGFPTALNNTEAQKVEKIFRNGQVVIIKNGVEYNAIGQKL